MGGLGTKSNREEFSGSKREPAQELGRLGPESWLCPVSECPDLSEPCFPRLQNGVSTTETLER